jgi:hypothetical protein
LGESPAFQAIAMTQSEREQKTVVVLGLARSGTSVITGILKILGVAMGSSVHDKANPFGSFEDRDFALLHREIFELASSESSYWNPPSEEAILGLKDQVRPSIEEMVARKSRSGVIWGWKHPRTVLTLELFLPALTNPHLVAVFRNPVGIAHSSVEHTKNYKSGRVDFLQALQIANFYYGKMVKILETRRAVPTICVAFEDVVSDPIEEARKLADFLDLELTEKKISAIKGLVISRDRIQEEKKKLAGIFRGKLPRWIRNALP